eukprot:jgi/Phyca11/509491/fgenesh2_kg.PHYCAscaffold_46_\
MDFRSCYSGPFLMRRLAHKARSPKHTRTQWTATPVRWKSSRRMLTHYQSVL